MPDSTPNSKPHLRVVAIGGGTGLSTLLRGLKRYVPAPAASRRATDAPGPQRTDRTERRADAAPNTHPCIIRDLAAIVTVTDDGGSSGRLREDLKMLPPGDVRNCMVALSEDEHLLARLFQYRFDQGDLEGHSFGNLFLAALSNITGDFAQAVQMSSHILATRGRIYPATNTNVTLAAQMDSGPIVRGETNITASSHSIVELMLDPATAEPLPETLEAIANADLITLGPGSLYTSLITNLLVRGIPEAIAASRATRVYIGNLMTQANESLGLTASQHIEKILQHCGNNGHTVSSKESPADKLPPQKVCHSERSEESPHSAFARHSDLIKEPPAPTACHSERSEEPPHFALARNSERSSESPSSSPYLKLFDYALINTAPISPMLLAQYASEGQAPIEPDLDRIRALGVEPIPGNFVHEGSVLRHDPDRITAALLQLALNRR